MSRAIRNQILVVSFDEAMRRQEFGCYCGVFSLALSSNGIFIPGSKNKPIYKSLFPFIEMNETTRHYVLRATNEDYVICETLVHVLWIGHHTEPEPFLGIRSHEINDEEFRGTFGRFIGKKVELSFIPFSAEVREDDDSKETQSLNEVVTIEPQHHNSFEINTGTVTNSTAGENSADYIIREYIDFVNQQVGVYMDAMSGFAGHHARVERQVCRIMRKGKLKENDEQPMVWASYEDPTKPDIIHNRIIRSNEYLSSNSVDGSNAQQHSQAILVFLFTYWEDEIRPRLAKSMNIAVSEIKSDIMGDLRIIRNVILHSKGIIRHDKHKGLKLLGDMFTVDHPVHVSYENIHKIFILIKQDCARLLLEWLGVKNSPNLKPEEFVDVALQLPRQRSVMSNPTDPYHAHIYYDGDTRIAAQRLHQKLNDLRASGAIPDLVLVGKMHDRGVGPHPKPQFEVQFLASALPNIVPMLKATGLTALVHPLTDDDLADHTTLAEWIGEPLPLDESVLDPPGQNQGIARFGKIDF